ncbi:bifunctional DNA primase/polymerase [Streptomyces laurentii]|uniref:bifunctional DNA primase/polymerase n=1 Tax=Streptomyces laurentii TaxID=39478 RepID=UPI0036B75420
MREILGRRRRLRFRRDQRETGTGSGEGRTSGASGAGSASGVSRGADGARGDGDQEGDGAARRAEALRCAAWGWPVLPGVGLRTGEVRTTGFLRTRVRVTGARLDADPGADPGRAAGPGGVVSCACPDPECVVPGAHPHDPELLAATTDARMIGWWWDSRPDAPVLLATGGRAPCAVSLPAVAGVRALAALDARGLRLGPVVATPTRWAILVAPYRLERLGELLYAKDGVPSSLRFHGDGGYLPLPPSVTGTGQVRWEREPLPDPVDDTDPARDGRDEGGSSAPEGSGRPWLPDVEAVLDALVEASSSMPGGGSRLAY